MGEEVLKFYRHWRKYALRPELWVISCSPVMSVEADIQNEVKHFSVDHQEVPALLRQAQAGVCFIKPSFSKLASAPTKLGEILACGLPVAANVIGDMEVVLSNSLAGVILEDFDERIFEKCARQLYEQSLKPETSMQARALAEKWFNLETAIKKYGNIYDGT